MRNLPGSAIFGQPPSMHKTVISARDRSGARPRRAACLSAARLDGGLKTLTFARMLGFSKE